MYIQVAQNNSKEWKRLLKGREKYFSIRFLINKSFQGRLIDSKEPICTAILPGKCQVK